MLFGSTVRVGVAFSVVVVFRTVVLFRAPTTPVAFEYVAFRLWLSTCCTVSLQMVNE